MQVLLSWCIMTDVNFNYSQNSPTSRGPISSGLQHTSKIYLLLDFIMKGEILSIVSDCRLSRVISISAQYTNIGPLASAKRAEEAKAT
jgi:hypothetical protein